MFNSYAAPLCQALVKERDRGDPFGWVDVYENGVRVAEEIAAGPHPVDAIDQIAALGRIMATMGPDGFGNVLDVTGVSNAGRVRHDMLAGTCPT